MEIETAIDRLYGLPLDEFTAARNELARACRADGDRDGAERVKALPKPSVAAWAVNQLARKEQGGVRALLAAGERLRAAQAELLAGGSGDELREASATLRAAVSELVPPARAIVASGGRAATEATMDRIAETLRAAATGEEGRELLERGRLTSDLDATGFGSLPPAAVPRSRPPTSVETSARTRWRERAEERVRELRSEVDRLEDAVRETEREAAAARRAAEDAERAAARERARLEEAAARLARAEEELRATR